MRKGCAEVAEEAGSNLSQKRRRGRKGRALLTLPLATCLCNALQHQIPADRDKEGEKRAGVSDRELERKVIKVQSAKNARGH